MDVMDVVILASMGALVVFFASVAVMDWMDGSRHEDQRADAQVIQHPQGDRRSTGSLTFVGGAEPRPTWSSGTVAPIGGRWMPRGRDRLNAP